MIDLKAASTCALEAELARRTDETTPASPGRDAGRMEVRNEHGDNHDKRSVVCTRACASMPDPVAAVSLLREVAHEAMRHWAMLDAEWAKRLEIQARAALAACTREGGE